jgi:nucleoside-diphosphate-sugar epimerase
VRRLVTHVLVTGGLGFIGSRLCAALLDEGLRVRCVDDLSGAYAPTSGPAAAARLAAFGAEVLVTGACPAHVDGVDAVIHLAGRPGVRSARSGAELRAANVELAGRLAAAAGTRGARFVLVSSSSVYGNAAELPTPEHAPPRPLNPYAESKVAAEAAVLARGGDPVVVRPFTVYGPGQRPDMAFARWTCALAAGEPVPWHAPPGTARDFTYVDDAVAGLVAALRNGRAGEAYNVSGGRSVPLSEALALLAGGECPALRELPHSATEALVTSGCGRRGEAELGYSPRVTLAAGLERQLDAASPGRLAA